MSKILPQSQLGRVQTKNLVDGFAKIGVIDERASSVLNLDPVDTVWGRPNGRPVYDRLPGISQGYREEYAGEASRGLVYIEPQFGKYSGPGSLEVGIWQNDPKVLVIYSGVITWAKGQIPTSTLAVNLETIIDGGVEDGSYQVGYYLDEEIPTDVGEALFSVSSFSLAGSSTVYDTNREAKDHPLELVFSDSPDGYWTPSEFNQAGTYSAGSWITFDFTTKVTASTFEISALNPNLATARCALYRSDDAIIWELADSVVSRDGVWTLNNSEASSRYFRAYFWDGKVTVSEVRYTGNALYPNRRPTGLISSAKIFLEPEYDQINRPHILLGLVSVSNFELTEIRDTRDFTSLKYEPVASWLTDYQDTSLRRLITDITDYANRYLAPSTAAASFYDDLLESGVTLASETSTPTISYPAEIELKPPTEVMSQFESTSNVSPVGVYLLGHPVDSSDLVPKNYIDTSFIPSLDNGKF